MERKLPGNFFSKILEYFARLLFCLKILENAVPFATGSCRKFRPDVWVEWKAPIDISSEPDENLFVLIGSTK